MNKKIFNRTKNLKFQHFVQKEKLLLEMFIFTDVQLQYRKTLLCLNKVFVGNVQLH